MHIIKNREPHQAVMSPTFEIDISIKDERWKDVIANVEGQTTNIITKVLNDFEWNTDTIDISIVLADDTFIQELNKTYRNKDKATNVLSFPQTEQNEITQPQPFLSLGDIIITYETINEEAKTQDKALVDHYTHMLVHGCLHLLHYDHITESEASEMESLEIEILQTFGIKNPYECV